jgi:hypothetical protein
MLPGLVGAVAGMWLVIAARPFAEAVFRFQERVWHLNPWERQLGVSILASRLVGLGFIVFGVLMMLDA